MGINALTGFQPVAEYIEEQEPLTDFQPVSEFNATFTPVAEYQEPEPEFQGPPAPLETEQPIEPVKPQLPGMGQTLVDISAARRQANKTILDGIRSFTRSHLTRGMEAINKAAQAEAEAIPAQTQAQQAAGEGALSIASGASWIPAGLFVAASVSPPGRLFQQSPGEVVDTARTIQEALTYQPRTKGGQQVAEVAAYPFTKTAEMGVESRNQWWQMAEKARQGGDNITAAGYDALGFIAGIGGEAWPFLVGPAIKASIKEIKNSATWRSYTVKERGLIVQSLADTINKNPEMTEAEILRKWNNPQWREEALAKRRTGESGETVKSQPGSTIPPEPIEEAAPFTPVAEAKAEPAQAAIEKPVSTPVEIPDFKSTGEAVAFSKVATPEQLEQVKALRAQYEADWAKAMEAKDLQEAINVGTKAQLMREVIEAKAAPERFDIKAKKTTPAPEVAAPAEKLVSSKGITAERRQAFLDRKAAREAEAAKAGPLKQYRYSMKLAGQMQTLKIEARSAEDAVKRISKEIGMPNYYVKAKAVIWEASPDEIDTGILPRSETQPEPVKAGAPTLDQKRAEFNARKEEQKKEITIKQRPPRTVETAKGIVGVVQQMGGLKSEEARKYTPSVYRKNGRTTDVILTELPEKWKIFIKTEEQLYDALAKRLENPEITENIDAAAIDREEAKYWKERQEAEDDGELTEEQAREDQETVRKSLEDEENTPAKPGEKSPAEIADDDFFENARAELIKQQEEEAANKPFTMTGEEPEIPRDKMTPQQKMAADKKAGLVKTLPHQKKKAIYPKTEIPAATTGTQKDMFADKGQANLEDVEKNKNDKPPSGFASTGEYATNVNIIMEMPELVEMAKQLMNGKYPLIRRNIGKALGRFYPTGEGKIKLRADIFESEAQAKATLAHEIGHLVDYIPDKTLKRGNILGRIAVLKQYMKHTIPLEPGAPAELTNKDRIRIRYEAEKLVRAEGGKWIDEIITKTMAITPEDILNIWNSVEQAKLINKDLYEYVARMGTAEKKAVVKEALKGQVPDQLKQFAKSTTEATGKQRQISYFEERVNPKTGKREKVATSEGRDAIAKKYADLINAELAKRKLWELDKMTKELRDLTLAWKPFNPIPGDAFTKYRFSSVELYADAISALMNAPGLLKATAPSFYEAFFRYLDRKPKMKKLYNEIQQGMVSGEVEKARMERLYDMFQKGDDAYAMSLEKRDKTTDGIMRELVDINWLTLKKIRQLNEREIPAGSNPRYKLEEMAYSGSEIEWYTNQIWRGAIRPLEDAGLTWDDFGVELYLRRVAGERSEMANPQGWTKSTAEKKLADLKTTRTPAQNKAMADAIKKFEELRTYVIDKGEAAQYWDQDLIKLMRDTPEYATFDVIKYIEKRYGRAPGAKIYKQIGTFNEVANPATATMLKDSAIISAINRNTAAKSTVDFFKKNYPEEIEDAQTKWNGRFHEIQDSPDSNKGLIIYLKNGEAHGYYVHRWIAAQFERNPWEAALVTKVLNWTIQPFRLAFTELNPGFWLFNMYRDYFRASTNMPGSSLIKFSKYYARGLKEGMKSVYGIESDAVQYMLKHRMLISVSDYRGLESADKEIERILRRYHFKQQTWNNVLMRPFGMMFTYYTNIGRGLERAPKVASFEYLKDKFPQMPDEMIGHIIRTQAGSPDFLRKGALYPITNNILMFSNAIKEGWRGDFESFADRPGEFMWKKAKYVYLPKLLMFAGSIGLLGAGVKAIMDGASEYDKANYGIIPLGLTENGKSVYLRIPVDETGRFMGGLLWKILSHDVKEMTTGLFDYMAGQAPTLHPGIDILTSVIQYASGQNPYDFFKGEYAIPEQIFNAGGARSHEEFLKWMVNKSGGTIVYRFSSDDLDKVKSELEKVLGFPIASNLIGRFVKVSDSGLRQDLNNELEKIQSKRAGELLDLKDIAIKITNGDQIDQDEKNLLLKEIATKGTDVFERNMLVNISRRHGYLYLEKYITATTNAEKAEVIKQLIERETLLKEANK